MPFALTFQAASAGGVRYASARKAIINLMRVTFVKSEATAQNIKTFYFKPDKPVRYLAGQFTELSLPHNNPDERGIKHWFTLSSSPAEELLSITTKFSDPGSTFKQTLQNLKKGQVFTAADPMGDFVLPKNSQKGLLFVAGGIGITPFRSMVKWLTDAGEKRDIHLIYAVSDQAELAFLDIFKDYGLRLNIITSNPTKDWRGLTGKLSGQKILDIIGPLNDRLLYISGPEPMVEALERDLLNKGVPREQLVGDFFPGYKPF